jgi:predicted site-specific integrase-resolvase
MNDKPKLYGPRETARRLGISVRMLQYYRSTGRIEGTSMGNTTAYTDEQIANAKLEKRKPGAKKADDESEFLIAITA